MSLRYTCFAYWSLYDNEGNSLENMESIAGVPVMHSTDFKSAVEYTVKIDLQVVPTEDHDAGTLLYSKATTLYSRYVRREVRKYSEDDRDKLMSTMRLLYDLSDVEGQALYGTLYRSMEYFVK